MPRKRNEQKEQNENYSKAFPTVMRQLMQTTTQAELAGYLSKTRQSITYYCDGSSSPDWETLVKIADYFNVSTDYLLGRTEDPDRHPCATDDLGLSAKAIQGIKYARDSGHSDDLIGLNILLENGRLINLSGEIARFIQRTAENIEVSKLYKSINESNGDADSDYYKLVLSFSESTLVSRLETLIESNYPKFKGEYQIIIGSNMVEYQKRCIVDTFDEILRQLSNYNEFRSGIVRREDILK